MFETTQTHSALNINSTALNAGPVVLYKSEQPTTSPVKRFFAGLLVTAFLSAFILQTNWVYNANAEDAPITSPVTAEESPSPSPSASPSENPVTAPEVSPSPSPSVSPSAPVTAPEVSPSPTPSDSGNSNNNGNSGGGSSSNSGGSSTPSCGNEAPKSAPKIISAITTGKNEITLTWDKAQGPVTNYVLAYGFIKNHPIYGNPNVGNTTSYTVKQLAGGLTYYFKVRASNDCQPGAFSEEIAVKVGGRFINAPAAGFKPGVLGNTVKASTKPALAKPVVFPSEQPKNTTQSDGGLVSKIFSFFSKIF